jgi:hypothetical protein
MTENFRISQKCVDRVLEVLSGDPMTGILFTNICSDPEKTQKLRQVLGTAIEGVLDGKL